jgi:hypothetical protein
VIRQIVLITVEVITDLHHVLQPNRRFTVAVIFLEPKTIKTTESSERTPAGGLARVLPTTLVWPWSTLLNEVEEIDFH